MPRAREADAREAVVAKEGDKNPDRVGNNLAIRLIIHAGDPCKVPEARRILLASGA